MTAHEMVMLPFAVFGLFSLTMLAVVTALVLIGEATIDFGPMEDD